MNRRARRFRLAFGLALMVVGVLVACEPNDSPDVDKRYASCAEATADGKGPYTKEDPEYSWYADNDGDGTVCES